MKIDCEREIGYWAGYFDDNGGSICIAEKTIRRPGRLDDSTLYVLCVGIGNSGELDYPKLLAEQFSPSCKPTEKWSASSQRAATFLGEGLPYLLTKRAQAELVLEFQDGKKEVNKLPPNERRDNSMSWGVGYYERMIALNSDGIYDESRFKIPDKLGFPYLVGRLEHSLKPHMEDRRQGRVDGLILNWRSLVAAERVQEYFEDFGFGGIIIKTADSGYRNRWGIEAGRQLLAFLQPNFKLRFMVDLFEPFMSDPILRKFYNSYHRRLVNLAVALGHPFIRPDQEYDIYTTNQALADVSFQNGVLAGIREGLDRQGLENYTNRSQEQFERILGLSQ